MLQRIRHRYRSVIDGQAPLRSLSRWPVWLMHCGLGKPAVARFRTGNLRMRLAPKLMHFGSTSIYIRRDNYEPELLATQQLIRPGSVVLDIGGSFGIFSLFMAHFVTNEGAVHTFEPGHFSFSQLQANRALNPQLTNIHLHNMAAASKPGELRLAHLAGSPVNFSIVGSGAASVEHEAVMAARVDSIVPAADWPRVSFVKIDVEGFELDALEGARGIIEAAHPTIMFEVSASALARQGKTEADILDFLRSFGYAFFVLDNGRFRVVDQAQGDNLFASIAPLDQPARH